MEGISPTVVFTVAGIDIRDTVVSTWIMMALVVSLAAVIGRRRPAALELIVDFISDTVSDIMGRPAAPYLPLLGSLAIFITFANILGVFPGLQAPTRDVNTPLGLALVVFFSVHYYGVRAKGVFGYLRDLAQPIFLLPLEIIGQLSRTLSLSLRLFGNILSAELIVAIIFSLLPLFVPLPLVGLGIFTGLLQAYIFTALAAVYIASAIQANPSLQE
ncbi:MAG: F0F1 ATP synthase subunit A [Anaerolineae bacterium]|jgi:F-type H+-transporting ATPase subunit a|nr:F0F1 ATP synthase subunit A [Anaerolineae bacterium]